MSDGANIGLLVNARNAIIKLYNDLFGKLTEARAGNLDNLVNISRGPVALDTYLGSAGDAPSMNRSLDGALVLFYQQLYTLDAQLRQLAASVGTVYTGATRQSAAMVGTGGNAVPLALTSGFISWDVSTYGSPIQSVKVFSPVIPTMHLIPPASGGAGYAQTLQMVVNGSTPSSSSPINLCGLVTSMVAGSPSIILGWNGSHFTLTCSTGTTTSTTALPSNIYPFSFLWTNEGNLVWTTSGGVSGTIAQAVLPPSNALYTLNLWPASSIQVVAFGYI